MKRLLLLFVVLTLAACSQDVDQQPKDVSLNPEFGTAGNDYAGGLAPSRVGVYVVGGTGGNLHGRNLGESDAYLRKYDRQGKLLWGRQFGTSGRDFASEVAVDTSDNTYVIGRLDGRAFIRKYSPSGGVLWSRRFGVNDYDGVSDVKVSSSGIYVVGSFIEPGSEYDPEDGYPLDAWVLKYNLDGSLAWSKQFGIENLSDVAEAVAVDSQGYAYVVGTLGYDTGPNGGYIGDMFIRQFSPNGSVPWARTIDFRTYDHDSAIAVAVSDKSVYVGGYSQITWRWPIETIGHLLKYDTRGKRLWAKKFTDTYLQDLSANRSGVVVGGYILDDSAEPNWDGYVSKLNPNGNNLWSKGIRTSKSDSVFAVVNGFEGEIYAAGHSDKGEGSGGYNAFLRQFNGTTGAIVWTR